MKLLLSWIFDHIDADWQRVDVQALVKNFNAKTAEIESVSPVLCDTSLLSLARVVSVSADKATVFSPEWQHEFVLPARKDSMPDGWYLIWRSSDSDTVAWATMEHVGGTKEHMLPALYTHESERSGGWKKQVAVGDYCIEVDNKSITNRPDMWGHRGFAREVAALLELPFKPFSTCSVNKSVDVYGSVAPVSASNPFNIRIETNGCKRFAGLFIPTIETRPSLVSMAIRLAQLDSRPFDMIVDCTNYVMLDISQPMHAFDADTLQAKTLVPRMAHAGEKLVLLEGQEVTFTPDDMVMTDGTNPVAVAGIKGGAPTAINARTTAVFLEAACWSPTMIRLTAARHRLRTDASARFEKTLDPNQTVHAITRFLKLLDDAGIVYGAPYDIIACGTPAVEKTISVSHDFIQKRLGITLPVDRVIEILERLEFGVTYHDGVFECTVPTFRSTKDVTIREDIVEEVGRFYGYTNILPHLPARQLVPADLHVVHQRRKLKSFMTRALEMHELENYSFFDEEFLRRLQWEPEHFISVQSPVSENWRRLVTALMPHMFKAIEQNSADHDQLRFFECARTWRKEQHGHHDTVSERKAVAGIFFEKKEQVDFYQAKKLLQQFFDAFDLNVTWHKPDGDVAPWYVPYQVAHIRHNDVVIGIAGKLNPLLLQNVAQGDAFAFELDSEYIMQYKPAVKKYVGPSKYPAAHRDISVLIPLQYTVAQLSQDIKAVNSAITHVELVDFFERAEWGGQRALTFRFGIQDRHKTLTKDEVEVVYNAVADLFKKIGATIR